jgi:hypothetical protein
MINYLFLKVQICIETLIIGHSNLSGAMKKGDVYIERSIEQHDEGSPSTFII